MLFWKKEPQISPNSPAFHKWLVAIRGKTLSAALSPIILSGAFAFYVNSFHLLSFLACIFCAFTIQIATNFINDAGDFARGADTEDRLGPPRAAQRKLLTVRQLYTAAAVLLSLAFLVGTYLIFRGGMPIFIIGILSIACAFLYTGGPYPLAYYGLGDFFAFVFFGVFAVCGSFYVQTHFLDKNIILLSFAIGFLVSSLIAVNNTRDIPTDRKANKKTLSCYMGEKISKIYCSSLMLFPYAIYLFLISRTLEQEKNISWLLLPILVFPFCIKNIFLLHGARTGASYNLLLGRTSIHLLLFSSTLALALLLFDGSLVV